MNYTQNIENNTADHLAIRQLIDRYNDMVNHRSWDAIDQIFATDAEWIAEAPINLTWSGLADIKVKLPASVERMEILIQTSSGVVIEVAGNDRASARSLLTEFGRNKETQEGMHSVCSYEDVIVKENGEWKFLKRRLVLLYNDQLPVPGNIKGYKY
jgi:tRNA uridine 5-carbamoylmethylation protein Kti12